MEKAFQTISAVIIRSEKAQEKFVPGTSHYALLKNRIKALNIASSLITKELDESYIIDYTKEELEKALAPIASLISKSEKAQTKLKQGTWQHTMLEDNLKAFYIALPLLEK